VSNPAERNNVCQPLCLPTAGDENGGRVVISSGYGKGCALLAVHRTGERYSAETCWSNRNLKSKFASLVVHGEHIYGLDERILTCLDLKTGTSRWKGGHYGFGQLILAGDLLIVQTESGDVALVEATPSHFHELGRFAALGSRTWNHPVLAGSLLLVRNDQEAACYELPRAEPDQ
jgi:outer membrane protein assembly factor BamB